MLPGQRLYANSIWIGPANADNYMPGRSGYRSQGVVVHHSAGTLEALIYRFENPPAVSGGGASAHFAISREEEYRDGLLGRRWYAIRYQLVDTADMAYADANYFENLTSDAVEHVRQWGSGVGTPGWEPILDSQYASSTELLMILSADEGWAMNTATITPHNLYTQTTCPGDLSIVRLLNPWPAPASLKENVMYLRDPDATSIWGVTEAAQKVPITGPQWNLLAAGGASFTDIPGLVAKIAAFPDVPAVADQTAVRAALAALKTELDALTTQGVKVDLTAVNSKLDILSKHVGVGTA